MAREKKPTPKRPIETYEHKDKQRVNNPPVGLVTPDTDPDAGAMKGYAYDPHLDPALQWAGKTEHTSFEVPTVSLHVHERIDPRTIIEAVKRRNGSSSDEQMSLFTTERAEPLRQAVEFYRHAHGWSNRLVAGDSLLVMNSLLEKEGLGGKVQMVYIDPPYGIRYGSNFQPFVNKRDVKDGSDDDLTQEPETLKAFRDTWELGIHSYLAYLRDRLLLAKELLHESGSCFVQIGDENIHLVRCLLDEIFGPENFIVLITVQKTGQQPTQLLAGIGDYIIWYAKKKDSVKARMLYKTKQQGIGHGSGGRYTSRDADGRWYRQTILTSSKPPGSFPVEFEGKTYVPEGRYWTTGEEGIKKLIAAGRIESSGKMINYKRYLDDFPAYPITSIWTDVAGSPDKAYVVQTSPPVIERCLLMTTDPGDLVLDLTCGSGTTAYVAEQWGRRWLTTDTSRVSITLARHRLMTATFDYYSLAHQEQGVGSGFKYKTVPHVTLKSIANNPEIKEGMSREQIDNAIAKYADTETLYDQPELDRKKLRVTGPFTVEAVPAPTVKTVDEILYATPQPVDASIARSGETLRQGEWRDELTRTGIRGKGGQHIRFARLEPLPGCRWLHADGETSGGTAQRIVVSFGPEHAPLEQRQVSRAIDEAQTLVPRPCLIVFAAFQFDPEAAKDIDETNWPGVTLLKAQMNADLLTDDLKKKRASNESFWLIGQPDVQIERIPTGEDKDKLRVMVQGFDYYNTKTGGIESGGKAQIAVWLLDTDYDGRSLYPRQVFFPMAGPKQGWARLAKNLKAEIDEDLIEAYRGTVSLPFAPGVHKRVAVKIVDDRGIESLKVMGVE